MDGTSATTPNDGEEELSSFLTYLRSISSTSNEGGPGNALQKQPSRSSMTSSGAKVGLDHLDNLCKLMEQLGDLKSQNTRLQRRICYLEDVRKLQQMHQQLQRRLSVAKDTPRQSILIAEEEEEEEDVRKHHQRRHRRSSKRNRQRSKSVGHGEEVSLEIRGAVEQANGSKKKISKWTKVKEAFKWERALPIIPCAPTATSTISTHRSHNVATMGVPTLVVDNSDSGVISSTESGRTNTCLLKVPSPGLGTESPCDSMLSTSPSTARGQQCDTSPLALSSSSSSSSLSYTSNSSSSSSSSTNSSPRVSDDEETEDEGHPMTIVTSSSMPSNSKLVSSSKSAWGRVKNIIQTRRDSLKAKSGIESAPSVRRKANRNSLMLELEPPSPSKETASRIITTPPAQRRPVTSKWTKVKKAFLTSSRKDEHNDMLSSVPSSPNRMSAFIYDGDDVEDKDSKSPLQVGFQKQLRQKNLEAEVQRDYLELQQRLSDEFHRKMSEWERSSDQYAQDEKSSSASSNKLAAPANRDRTNLSPDFKKKLHEWEERQKKKTKPQPSIGEENLPPEFRKKLVEWEIRKAVAGKSQSNVEELQKNLPQEFNRKLQEWERIRSGGNTKSTKRDKVKMREKGMKEFQWLERELQKVEREKQRLQRQRDKFLEREARLEKMREAMSTKKSPHPQTTVSGSASSAGSKRKEVFIRTSTGDFRFEGISHQFTRKLYEWEERRGIAAEDSTFALLAANQLENRPSSHADDKSLCRSKSDGSIVDLTQPVDSLLPGESTTKVASEPDLRSDGPDEDDEDDSTLRAVIVDVHDPYAPAEVTKLIDSSSSSSEKSADRLIEENISLLNKLKESEDICRKLENRMEVIGDTMDDVERTHQHELEKLKRKESFCESINDNEPNEMVQLRRRIRHLEACGDTLRRERATLQSTFEEHSEKQTKLAHSLLQKMCQFHEEVKPEEFTTIQSSVARIEKISGELIQQAQMLEKVLAERNNEIRSLRCELRSRLPAGRSGVVRPPGGSRMLMNKQAHQRSWSSAEGISLLYENNGESTSAKQQQQPDGVPDSSIVLANKVEQLKNELSMLLMSHQPPQLSEPQKVQKCEVEEKASEYDATFVVKMRKPSLPKPTPVKEELKPEETSDEPEISVVLPPPPPTASAQFVLNLEPPAPQTVNKDLLRRDDSLRRPDISSKDCSKDERFAHTFSQTVCDEDDDGAEDPTGIVPTHRKVFQESMKPPLKSSPWPQRKIIEDSPLLTRKPPASANSSSVKMMVARYTQKLSDQPVGGSGASTPESRSPIWRSPVLADRKMPLSVLPAGMSVRAQMERYHQVAKSASATSVGTKSNVASPILPTRSGILKSSSAGSVPEKATSTATPPVVRSRTATPSGSVTAIITEVPTPTCLPAAPPRLRSLAIRKAREEFLGRGPAPLLPLSVTATVLPTEPQPPPSEQVTEVSTPDSTPSPMPTKHGFFDMVSTKLRKLRRVRHSPSPSAGSGGSGGGGGGGGAVRALCRQSLLLDVVGAAGSSAPVSSCKSCPSSPVLPAKHDNDDDAKHSLN